MLLQQCKDTGQFIKADLLGETRLNTPAIPKERTTKNCHVMAARPRDVEGEIVVRAIKQSLDMIPPACCFLPESRHARHFPFFMQTKQNKVVGSTTWSWDEILALPFVVVGSRVKYGPYECKITKRRPATKKSPIYFFPPQGNAFQTRAAEIFQDRVG